ncbi:MAG: hypothetical protein JSU94_13895 [Phycisphaerales bacterium]|nr:MAG: hypothetical protein JSU94_13895 [Phycisphaerales bacterium]
MKNSKEYSKKVQKLYRSLRSKHGKVERISYEEPAEALVHGIISEHIKQRSANSAMKRFGDYFVDLNDLRVSRIEEILEMLGEDTCATRQTASALTKVLRNIFNEYHRVSLEDLKKMGKRPARHVLEKMEGASVFAVDYVMLTALQGHAIPLTATMTAYLKKNELVYPEADDKQIEGFLAKQISARNAYEFYVLLREASELAAARAGRRGKTVGKKSPKRKIKAKKAVRKRKKAAAKQKK